MSEKKKVKRTKVVSVTKTTNQPNEPFPIVAIGASAGGLEAVSELLKSLPDDSGMAYVYIQHLDPTHQSMLPTILSRVTNMKVVEAEHLMPIEPNHVFIIPPNKDMAIIDGVLTLNERAAKPAVHLPIDKFFVSLAEKQKEAAIGVILSGSANDGTLGLKSIKIAGGITFAQDDSAKFNSMPRSAIAEGVVDKVLSPKSIAEELGRISKNKIIYQQAFAEHVEEENVSIDDIRPIIQLIKRTTGTDFIHYKINTIRRRILRRMLLNKFEGFGEYLQHLKDFPAEINVLYDDLLINVTTFFRDADTADYLKEIVLPKLLEAKTSKESFRVWIPACSTGEEAYSLAILLAEAVGETAGCKLQIFATDLSDLAIAKARLGIYSKNDLVNVTPKRLQSYFTKIDGSYRINKGIRDICVFAPHNVFKDPPFSRLDMISCCNLMIYLDSMLQKKLLGIFHYALKPNGYLILGKAETTTAAPSLFIQPEKKNRIFIRKDVGENKTKFEVNYPTPEVPLRPSMQNALTRTKNQSAVAVNNYNTKLEKSIDEILLSKYVPPSIIVNQDLEILQFKGSTGMFLEPSSGRASLNLLKMARPGLAYELRSAIHKSYKTGAPVKQKGINVKHGAAVFHASIEVVPVELEADEKLFLIVFEEDKSAQQTDTKAGGSKDKIVHALRQELETVKEDMRSMLEEQETTVEELQSANEEIVSSNEELQSINEELETSKEEVESTNEELMMINSELQVRNEQLSESYEYAEAVFETIREAVLVLDESFRVKTANRAFYTMFNATEEETEGKLIYELGDRHWDIHDLRRLLEQIVPENNYFNGFEVQHTFPNLGEKVMLLNARRIVQKVHRKLLILLAIEDITEHRQAQKLMAERESWLRNMANNAPVMIWVEDENKMRTFFNKTWLDFTGKTQEQLAKEGWKEVIHPDDRANYVSQYNQCFEEKAISRIEYRLKRYDNEYRWVLDVARPAYDTSGEFTGYIGSCADIHERKGAHLELENRVLERTQDLEEINKELQRSNDELQQFAYVASHDLQEPLRKIITFADRIQRYKENLPDGGPTYLEKIVDSSKRMTRLIDDLLNYSRLSTSPDKFKKVSLNNTLKEVIIDFELIIKEKGAEIDSDNLPEIEAIPIQMVQLFHNLVSNAFKFAKADVPSRISIKHRKLTSEEVMQRPHLAQKMTYHELIITDNGIGFNSEFSDQIFVIFQRLNEKQQYPGTGIGLALCRKIVENHHGQIYAEAKENEGAVFHILLPAHQPK